MPSLSFYSFLVKFAEMLVSKPRNDQSETHWTMEHPFEKLAGCQVECKDEMMSRTGGVEVTMNPRLRFFTHHFKGCQFP
jgi:hypothetical protein